jgi:hypothetical protein
MTLGGNPNNIPLKRKWWAYQAHRPELYIRIRQRERIVAMSQVTAHFAFAILPSDYIYAHTLNVFDISSFGRFACLQSRVHEIWTRFFASSLEDRLRYTPSDCFATFAFPPDDQQLMAAGETYVSYRASLMGSLGCGLTSTYNRFHDPYEKSPEIQKLRDLHEAMDRAVLEAYGWHDLAQTAKCEFLLDYEEEEDSGFGVGGSAESRNPKPQSRRRKPYRLRWPDDFRDEVLARLLELNEQRHKEELLAARTQSSEKKQAAKKDAAAKPKRARKKSAEGQKGLEFDNG